jgi:DUF1365 family protein
VKTIQHPENLLDLDPMTLPQRIRAAARSVWHIMRTGRHDVANALATGIKLGMDGGFAAALGEYNARLSAEGIDPIRGL